MSSPAHSLEGEGSGRGPGVRAPTHGGCLGRGRLLMVRACLLVDSLDSSGTWPQPLQDPGGSGEEKTDRPVWDPSGTRGKGSAWLLLGKGGG